MIMINIIILIQGTASVVVAGVLAAMKTLGSKLADHTFLFQVLSLCCKLAVVV